MMMPLPQSRTDAEYNPYVADTSVPASPDPMQWVLDRERQATLRMRGPVISAAHRIGLASSRCYELAQQLDATRRKRLNPPAWAPQSELDSLDQQIRRMEAELHDERTSCWRDLQPLLTQSQDHAIEMMRAVWLDELVRGAAAHTPQDGDTR